MKNKDNKDENPQPKFKVGQLVRFITDENIVGEISKKRGFYFPWLREYCGNVYRVCDYKFAADQHVYFYEITRNNSFNCVSEDLLEEYI